MSWNDLYRHLQMNMVDTVSSILMFDNILEQPVSLSINPTSHLLMIVLTEFEPVTMIDILLKSECFHRTF